MQLYHGQDNEVNSRAIIVCILTGHGLKDPDRAIKESSPPVVVPADEKKIMKIINQRRFIT